MVPTGGRLALMLSAIITALGALGAGCGPITATSAIYDASVALDAARGAKAPQFAVYEFVSAELYLRKAREEEGFSDFQAAVDFANKATAFAARAKERASERTREGAAPTTGPARRPAETLGPPPVEGPRDEDLPSGGRL